MIIKIDDEFCLMLGLAVKHLCNGEDAGLQDIIMGYITPLIPQLNDLTLKRMEQYVREGILMHKYTRPELDLPIWVQFHEDVKKELSNRGAEFWK